MASFINRHNVDMIGLKVNSPFVVQEKYENNTYTYGFSVLAHQIDWRQTSFAGNDISTYAGSTYSEKLLNAIESYICNHNMTGNVNGDVTGGVTGSFKGAIYTATSDSSYTYAIPFLSKRDANGFSYAYVDSKNSLTWNPNTDTISLKNISASGEIKVNGNEVASKKYVDEKPIGGYVYIEKYDKNNFETALKLALAEAKTEYDNGTNKNAVILDCTYFAGTHTLSSGFTGFNLQTPVKLIFGSIKVIFNNPGNYNLFNILHNDISIVGINRNTDVSQIAGGDTDPNGATLFIMDGNNTNSGDNLNGYHIKSSGYKNILIDSITLKGKRSAMGEYYQSTSHPITGIGGIYIEKGDPAGTATSGKTCNNVRINNVLISDTKAHGIYLNTPILSSITNTRLSGCGGHGIYILGGTSINIENVYASSGNFAGFCIQNASYVQLANCVAETFGIGFLIRGSNSVTLHCPGVEQTSNFGRYPWRNTLTTVKTSATNNSNSGIFGLGLKHTGSNDIIKDVVSGLDTCFIGYGIYITGGDGINIFSPYIKSIGQNKSNTIGYPSGTTPSTQLNFISVVGEANLVNIINPHFKMSDEDLTIISNIKNEIKIGKDAKYIDISYSTDSSPLKEKIEGVLKYTTNNSDIACIYVENGENINTLTLKIDNVYEYLYAKTAKFESLNVDGDITIGGKLSITDSTKVDNLNADMLDGMHISGIDNKYWGTVTYVKSGDGVMEIGKYIDFHHNKEGESDYSTRISSQNTSTKNTITLPTNDGTLHVGDFIKSDAGDKELDTTTSSNGLAVLTGLSFDTTTGKVSYCTHDIYHGNSGIEAPGTYGLDATKTYTLNNCQFFVPEFTVNAQGHITAASEKLITISPNTDDVASKTHTHTLTPSGSISGSSHKHTFKMVNGTSSENGSHNHTFTGSEVTTSSISGTKSFYQITGVGSAPTRAQVTVASSDHTHKLTAAGDVNIELNQTSTASKKPDSTNITSVATGAHTHTTVGNGKHTPSGTVTSTFTGVEVDNHSHTTSGTAASAGAHTHTLSGTSSSNGAHTHTLSGTSSSNGAHTHTTSGTAASAGAHTHTLSGTSSSNGAHTHTLSGTSSSNGAHTHTSNGSLSGSEASGVLTISFVSAATSSNGAHTHTYSATTSSAGAHTHTYSATTSSAGAHTHTTSGTAASAGAHTHTYSATTSSAGAHTHTYSATTSSAGAHTHTTSGTAADAGKHTPSGTVTSTFTGNEVAAHTHTINATGSTVNMPNANHTHNYDKATVKSASFTGNEVTTSSISGTTSFYQITGVGSTPSRAQVTVASSDHTHKLTASGTISNNGAHTHTYTYISSINNAAPTLTFTGTSAITTSTPSATTTVVIK